VSRNTALTVNMGLFLREKISVVMCIFAGNAKDRPNYDVT